MHTKEQICENINEIFPDIGICGINFSVDFDRINNFWVVSLKKDNPERKTTISFEDASRCMNDNLCSEIGQKVSQLRDNINNMRYS
jgi:hypothetical protein